ncbi:MAG: DUF3370 domain-containing protein [Scytolyngbya sp. HA4215-MV1]|nr:DUF3370 domain-containing protein [Scytolyngbya sp. HA4215-MV1]
MAGEDATIQDVVIPGPVRALPGRLDQVPLVSSNSPEWIKTGGILLSSFPPQGKTVAAAHLNLPLQGKFNLFTHHFTHTPKDLQTLYLGVIVQNPGKQAVTIDILQAASYLMEPDAPFKNKPPILENPNGEVFSGPGIRAVDTVLRGQRQKDFPAKVVIPPGEYRLLMNQPIPVKGLERPINGRSTFMRLQSSGTVYVADLAMFAPKMVDGSDRPPTLQEWQQLLLTGNLAGPRDKTPTPPNQVGGALIYSRVAGVQQGSTWQAQLVDPGKSHLALPAPGQPVSYAISTLRGGRLGTEQTQAAKLLVRYPDTAYESHANYATLYDLRLPLLNPTNQSQTFTLTLATPIKEDKLAKSGVLFRRPPPSFPYFRGTVRLRYADDLGHPVTRYLHLWQRTGQLTDPLVTLQMKPGEKRFVRLDFFYPPDSTPPQILTIATQAKD